MNPLCKIAGLLAALSWSGVCLAAEPSPADASSAPAVEHRSPVAGYRPLRDFGVGDWRAHNRRVGEAGGWRQYLRESAPPSPTASAPGARP